MCQVMSAAADRPWKELLLADASSLTETVKYAEVPAVRPLPIACALADQKATEVHLIESNKKKAGFLREAVRVTGAPAIVHAERVAHFASGFRGALDVVTARAVAPLPELLSIAYPLLKTGAQGVFSKGQDVEAELTEATKCWSIQASFVPSRTDPKSWIVVIREPKPKR